MNFKPFYLVNASGEKLFVILNGNKLCIASLRLSIKTHMVEYCSFAFREEGYWVEMSTQNKFRAVGSLERYKTIPKAKGYKNNMS